jgi:hypothetical protein
LRSFTRDGDFCVAAFEPAEADAIRHAAQEIAGLVDAYNDSRDDAAEFHRLTDADLTQVKLGQVDVILATLPEEGGEVRLDAEAAEAWLRALTDVRLALGVSLDISEDTDLTGEIDDAILADPSSHRAAALTLYGFLTYVQETLVGALAGW